MKITKVDVLHLKTNLKNGHWRPIVCRIYTCLLYTSRCV